MGPKGNLAYLAIHAASLLAIAGTGISRCAANEMPADLCPKGWTLYESGDFKSAVKEYCQCIKQDSSQPIVFRARGLAYMGLGEFRKALQDFESAGEPTGVVQEAQAATQSGANTSDNNPEWLQALDTYHRADHLAQIGKTKEAVEEYRNALSVRPNFPDCWDHMAHALEMDSQQSEAAKYFVKAIAWRPKNAAYWSHLSELLYNQGNLQSSKDALSMAVKFASSEDERKQMKDTLSKVDERLQMQIWQSHRAGY